MTSFEMGFNFGKQKKVTQWQVRVVGRVRNGIQGSLDNGNIFLTLASALFKPNFFSLKAPGNIVAPGNLPKPLPLMLSAASLKFLNSIQNSIQNVVL